MKTRLGRVGALVAIAAIVVTACSSGAASNSPAASTIATTPASTTPSVVPSTGQVVLGMSFCYLNNSGMVAFRDAEKAAAEALGWKVLQPTDSGNSPAKQLTDIDNLINQGVTALDIHACAADGIVPAIQKANAANIPVFTPDQPANSGKVAIAATVDNVAAAAAVCDELLKALTAQFGSVVGPVIEVQGDIGSQAGAQRTQGFEDCMKAKAPNVKILVVPTKWDGAAGAAGVDTLLNANADVKAIFFQSDIVFSTAVTQALTTRNALFPVGDPKHIILTGIDGGCDMLKLIQAGSADQDVSQPLTAYGPIGMEILDLAIQGKLDTVKPGTSTLSKSTGMQIVTIPTGLMVVVPATVVTKANATDPTLWANAGGCK